MGEYNLQSLVSRNFDGQIANFGEKVNVPLAYDFGEADTFTPGSAIGASAITQASAEVTLNISKRKTIGLTAKELSMSPYDLIQNYGVGMIKSLVSSVNKAIYAEALKTPYWIDATGGITEDLIADAGTKLSSLEVGTDGRIAVVSPDAMGALNKRDAFQYVDNSGNSDVMSDGIITRRMGFDFYQNNAIAKYTPADVTGATVGAFDAGVTTIVCNSFADGALPVRPGDIFTIADQDPATKYTVLSTTVTSTHTTGITFYPALVTALAAEAPKVITVTPTQSALCFVPSAIALAARTYGMLPVGVGVQSSVMDYQGLPIRISVFHDGKLGLGVQADVLCGTTLVNSNRMVRVVNALG